MFLLASRYCETDLLSDVAWSRFGQTAPGWSRVQAICDFVHNHIVFDYQQARPTRTAWEAFNERMGVCRDYAHLAIALCRCMNIPARYCTGYLGDMGTLPPYGLMDFAAWIEVYLGGAWHTFDPRNNVPRIGRVLIARGRDATDVAIATTFGPNTLESFKVWTDEIAESVPQVNLVSQSDGATPCLSPSCVSSVAGRRTPDSYEHQPSVGTRNQSAPSQRRLSAYAIHLPGLSPAEDLRRRSPGPRRASRGRSRG